MSSSSRIFRAKLIVYRKKLRLLVETGHRRINKRCGHRRILIRLFLRWNTECGETTKTSNDVRLRKERGVKSGSEIYVGRFINSDTRILLWQYHFFSLDVVSRNLNYCRADSLFCCYGFLDS